MMKRLIYIFSNSSFDYMKLDSKFENLRQDNVRQILFDI